MDQSGAVVDLGGVGVAFHCRGGEDSPVVVEADRGGGAGCCQDEEGDLKWDIIVLLGCLEYVELELHNDGSKP